MPHSTSSQSAAAMDAPVGTRASTVESSPRYYGWRVLLAAAVGQAFSPGPVLLVLVGALAQGLAQAFGVPVSRVFFVITVFNLCSIPAAPLIGRLTDRFGARRVLLASIGVMLAFLVAFATFTTSIGGLYVIFGIAGFATMGAQSITYSKLVTAWFDRRRGAALGLSAAGLGLGYTILPLIVSSALAFTNWQGAVLVLAAVLALAPLALNFLFARPPAASPAARAVATSGMPLGSAARTRAFWTLGGAIFLVSFVSTALVPNLFPFAKDVGVPPSQMAAVASTFGFATLVGRLVIGGLLDWLFAPWVAAAAFALSGLGFVVLAAVASGAVGAGACLPAVILIGLGFAAESDVIGYFTSRFFGLRYFGQIYGCLLGLFIVGVAAGPFAFSVVRETVGSFSPVFAGAAAIAVLAAILMLAMPPYPKVPASPGADAGSA